MNQQNIVNTVALELGITPRQVEAVLSLLSDGGTVPFIARYRKEATEGLDETQIIAVRDRSLRIEEIEKRRNVIVQSLSERDLLNPEIEEKIRSAETLASLEDIYLPFRPKKRTRASMAKEKGLEALALLLYNPKSDPGTIEKSLTDSIDPEKGVHTKEEALQGASDIMAEWINENSGLREMLRALFRRRAYLTSRVGKGKEKDGEKYKDYFNWSEQAKSAPSHRVLAVFRGTAEGFLTSHVLPPEEEAFGKISEFLSLPSYRGTGEECTERAIIDGYRRLLAPSLENELKQEIKRTADTEAIRVFSENLRELLLSPPLGEKRILALDPGLRTGCKIVCLDEQGNLMETAAVYPLPPVNKREEAASVLKNLVQKHRIEAVAVGNGTGGREALAFCEEIFQNSRIIIASVNESGASVYSASRRAREEFPDYDVTVRGAVSIGRRLMDPLAELVKIDPKAIGVGQYQHDVDQKLLRQSLEDVVVSCVNAVGVDVNTASADLLTYVAGLNAKTAGAITAQREKKGAFKNRKELLTVKGMGEKSFEQAAGFLRIRGGDNPLDQSAVHPERYSLVKTMARDMKAAVEDLIRNETLRQRVNLKNYISASAGLPTLEDILSELAKPGRDPREDFQLFRFSESVHSMEDLREGMTLPGIITNVTDFGAFVDIGVHQDGLVHISEISDTFVKDPSSVVRVQQKVSVMVLSVDIDRKRIALSMKRVGKEKKQ